MKHIFKQTVYYGDTDAYGVAWHGSYLRWMEQARVEFCRDIGLDLVEMKNNNIVIPVTHLNIRYKASAKLDDKIIVETSISKLSPLTITFLQVIKHEETDKVFTIGEIEVVAVNNGDGKIYRRMPDVLRSACEKTM